VSRYTRCLSNPLETLSDDHHAADALTFVTSWTSTPASKEAWLPLDWKTALATSATWCVFVTNQSPFFEIHSKSPFMTTLTMFLSTHLLASMSELPLSWEHETLPRVMIAAPSEASHVYWTVVLMLAGAPGRLQTISRTSEDFPVQRRPGGKLTLLRRIQKRLFRVRSPKALDPRSSIRHRRLPTCPPAAQDQLCSLHRCRSSAR
jgi:hypothetical protein